jgi:Replication-relaxation
MSSSDVLTPRSYADAHRYDGAAIHHDRVPVAVPCATQPRDVAIIHDVWRYKFLSAPQILELWWPGKSVRAGQRRLSKLCEARYLERFRPITRRGSFPWVYQLGVDGHRLLQAHGLILASQRYVSRGVYDYSRVLHELQLNAWVLAYRRLAGPALLTWNGEVDIDPPTAAKHGQMRLTGDWSAKGLRNGQARLIRPDAVLEIADDADDSVRTFLVEFDRTRRVDKNFTKFRRYDAFLNWWWRDSPYAESDQPPYVVFVCHDQQQREQFMAAADHELTGHRWHPSVKPDDYQYVGRKHCLFAIEQDAHRGSLDAWRLPAYPRQHPARTAKVRRVHLPATDQPSADQSAHEARQMLI